MRLSHRDAVPDLTVVAVDEVHFRLVPGRWSYGTENRAAIDADWRARRAANPALYNGRFFVLVEWDIVDGTMTGACCETDYASFLHWRAAGFPPPAAWNAFAMAALYAECGRLLIGRMAGWTANAGRWYPPAGSLEENDITPDLRFDLIGNMRRELAEEIGLEVDEAAFAPGWTVVIVGGRIAMFRRIAMTQSADALIERFSAYLATEERPELDALRFVNGSSDLDGLDVQPFFRAFVERDDRSSACPG